MKRVTPLKFTTEQQLFFSDLHAGVPDGFVMFQGMDDKKATWFKTGQPIHFTTDTIKEENRFFSVNPVVQIVTDVDRNKEKNKGKSDKKIAPWVASKDATVAATNAFFADIDGKGFVNPTDEEIDAEFVKLRADPAKTRIKDKGLRTEAIGNVVAAKFKANRETYLAFAKAYVDAITPHPSYIVFTGGGFQLYWLLKETLTIRKTIDEASAHVFSYVQSLLKRWVQHFSMADQKVADPRRVLRVVGSENRKPSNAPDYPEVTFYKKERVRYDLQDLIALLPPIVEPEINPVVAKSSGFATQSDGSSRGEKGQSVIHAFNAKFAIEAMLAEQGYTKHGDRYMRPGATDSPGVEIDTATKRSRHWSSNDPLYDSHWRTPFDVLCILKHNGDVRAAVKEAAEILGMVRKPEFVAETVAIIMQWLMTTNISDQLPHGPGRLKTRPVSMTILSKMAESGRFTITFGPGTIGVEAGVSRNTVLNVLELLEGKIFTSKKVEGFGVQITLLDNGRLHDFDRTLDVDKQLNNTCQKRQNDYSEYTSALNVDAFATGTSRFKRREIDRLARKHDMTFPQAREKFTKAGLGEGVLFARSVALQLGDMTAQEYADFADIKLSQARKHLSRAESMGLAETERKGANGPKVYTFVPDFWDKIIDLMPSMRTYKINAERHNRMLLTQQEGIARSLKIAKTAEETAELTARSKAIGFKRLPLLRNILSDLGKTEAELHAQAITVFAAVEDMKFDDLSRRQAMRMIKMAGYSDRDLKPAFNLLFPYRDRFAPAVESELLASF